MTAPVALPHGTASCYTNHGCRRDECRAAASEYRRQLRAANPEQQREAQRRWREANPERVAEYTARRREQNRAGAAKRREAKRAAEAAARDEALRAATAPFEDLLEARARALSVTIARAPFSRTAAVARHRRSEIRDLLAYITGTTA